MLVTSGLFYAIVPSGATLALRVLSSHLNSQQFLFVGDILPIEAHERPAAKTSEREKNVGEKQFFFTSLEVFVVFNSTKVNSREKKQNKQGLFFILHKKTSKSI